MNKREFVDIAKLIILIFAQLRKRVLLQYLFFLLQLKQRFANLPEGVKIISSKAFRSLNFRISERNLGGKFPTGLIAILFANYVNLCVHSIVSVAQLLFLALNNCRCIVVKTKCKKRKQCHVFKFTQTLVV